MPGVDGNLGSRVEGVRFVWCQFSAKHFCLATNQLQGKVNCFLLALHFKAQLTVLLQLELLLTHGAAVHSSADERQDTQQRRHRGTQSVGSRDRFKRNQVELPHLQVILAKEKFENYCSKAT
ncbi:hypothetical protein E2C01_065124 [Portunus trituberculatus]|uniref:Uncharacterized protein n=1 Tax=Portunus trituberculatus TaxID=210409 RepID=A0A5B7HL15_PORTR|nr:hypothetical protein [Portunus trituberculatus]